MNKSSETLLKAISNTTRLEILTFIQQQKFVIKSDILNHFELKRASLDFHLTSLDEAGLIGVKEIRLNNRKYVFVFAKATWKMTLTKVDTAILQDVIPSEITEEGFYQLIESFWIKTTPIKDLNIVKTVLESLSKKLTSESSKYHCNRCETEQGIMKCSECHKLYCTECAKIINKTDGNKTALCYDCISDQFS